MGMYDLLMNMWKMKTITAARLDNAVTRNYITAEQRTTILATPQVNDAV